GRDFNGVVRCGCNRCKTSGAGYRISIGSAATKRTLNLDQTGFGTTDIPKNIQVTGKWVQFFQQHVLSGPNAAIHAYPVHHGNFKIVVSGRQPSKTDHWMWRAKGNRCDATMA